MLNSKNVKIIKKVATPYDEVIALLVSFDEDTLNNLDPEENRMVFDALNLKKDWEHIEGLDTVTEDYIYHNGMWCTE